ncbi:hypothetical protein B0H16DRAFT_1498218 [Mycena metata]|uniref:NAD(P)-binding protein n=1 Tax=Mycena metata TaxID=1033252 RepID=A0AAD7NZE5_9AGAR|nr:hypothetical protein B0H16DRAFT_1498218 [Mycena metata]
MSAPKFAPVKTCVLGVGLSGLAFHIPFVLALPEYFTLVSVLERNPQSEGGKLHKRFGVSVKIHNTLEQVLGDPEIELVIIGTPSPTHFAYAKAALEAGKHVLVDKPVTSTSAEARELGQLAKAKGLVLYAFQNRRFDSDFISLKKLLALPASSPQSIGDVVELETHFDRYRKGIKNSWKDQPAPGIGHTYDLGTHLMDQALALFGRPDKLTAFIQNTRGVGHPDVDDSFTIYMQFAAGGKLPRPVTVIARAQLTSVRALQPRYVVLGTKGSFLKFGVDIQEDQLKIISTPNAIHEIWHDVTTTKTIWPSEPGCYADLFRNLAAAIREGAEQAIKWEEATAVIEMVELAHKSSKEGVTIVVPK